MSSSVDLAKAVHGSRHNPGGPDDLSSHYATTTVAAAKVAKDSQTVNVLDHGVVGNGVADDTAALTAAIAALPSTGGTLLLPRGLVSKVAGSITLSALNKVHVIGHGATLVQTTLYSKTLQITGCDAVTVEGLAFTGLGTEFTQPGHVGTNSTYNLVAGIFVTNSTNVRIDGCTLTNHAGGGIRWTGTLVDAWFTNCSVTGVGTAGGIATADNNGDFAVGNIASTVNKNIHITDCTLSGHCFGISVGLSDGLHCSRNIIRDIPGQHGMYLSACSGAHVTDNHVKNVALNGIKNQISSGSSVDVHDSVCTGNVVDGCQNGIVWSPTSPVGTAYSFFNVLMTNNQVSNASQDGINTSCMVRSKISGNVIDTTGRYGIYADSFDGDISKNLIRHTDAHGILTYITELTTFHDNTLIDCALNTVAEPAYIYGAGVYKAVNAVPTRPLVSFKGNTFASPAGDPASMVNVVITATDVGVLWFGNVNLTGLPWRFGTAGELLHADVSYSPKADFHASSNWSPSTPISGRGKRDLYGSQSPSSAGMTALFRQGDICWNSGANAGGTVGWVCTTSGTPGVWSAFGATAGSIVPPAFLLNGAHSFRESCSRDVASGNLTPTSGVELFSAVPVYVGDVITTVTFINSTVLTMGTNNDGHVWAAIRDTAGNLLRQATDLGGTVTWAAGLAKSFTLSSPYTVTGSDTVFYATLMINVGTGGTTAMPAVRSATLSGGTMSAGAITGQVRLAGTSGTALTGTAPAGPVTPATAVFHPYVVLS